LQPVEPDKIQTLVFLIGKHRPRRCRLFADDFDHVTLDQSQFAQIVPGQPGQSPAAVFRPGIGHLQFQQLAFVFGGFFGWLGIGHWGRTSYIIVLVVYNKIGMSGAICDSDFQLPGRRAEPGKKKASSEELA